jgi:hypothetical protein
LDSSDAHFVDIVHTNGGLQGDIEEIGDVDFYMNGGISQPGCFNNKKGKVDKMIKYTLARFVTALLYGEVGLIRMKREKKINCSEVL